VHHDLRALQIRVTGYRHFDEIKNIRARGRFEGGDVTKVWRIEGASEET
jgi:hypothetical protein